MYNPAHLPELIYVTGFNDLVRKVIEAKVEFLLEFQSEIDIRIRNIRELFVIRIFLFVFFLFFWKIFVFGLKIFANIFVIRIHLFE